MSGASRLRAPFAVLAGLTASLALAATAGAASGGAAIIEAQDACDPATFPPGFCVRADGNSGPRVSFDAINAELARKGAHGAWRFKADHVKVKAGQPVLLRLGRGGEFHTFTKVSRPGPGCVPEINALIFGSPAVNDVCNDIVSPPGAPRPFVEDGIPTDGTAVPLAASKLQRGTNLFECMIHPWMTAKVTVE
jgi:hypothetical protein